MAWKPKTRKKRETVSIPLSPDRQWVVDQEAEEAAVPAIELCLRVINLARQPLVSDPDGRGADYAATTLEIAESIMTAVQTRCRATVKQMAALRGMEKRLPAHR
jgi:hypothetical protein